MTRRLRILIVGQGPPTTGGIPTFITRLLADGWLRERADVDYLNTTPPGQKVVAAFAFSNLRLAIRHSIEVFRRARHADIVHLNLAAVPLLPLVRAFALCVAARLAGAAVILHMHTGRLERQTGSVAFRLMLRATARVADTLIVVSEPAAAAVRRMGARAVSLANGVDPSEFPTGPKQHDPLVLTFVGTVCERKGLIELGDALVRMRDDGFPPLDVRIIGDGTQEGPGAEERVHEAFAASGLTNVRFLGAQDRSRVIEELAATSIFCLPSHWEGFPLSLLEGMAAGAAPVATAVGDIPKMLDEGRAGVVVPPHDPAALASALERLVRDPARVEELGRAARHRVETQYSEQRMIRALFEIYERVGRRRGPE